MNGAAVKSAVPAVRLRAALAIAVYVIVAASVALSLVGFFTTGGEGNMQVVGWRAFRYFTVDSNVLAALGGLACIPSLVRTLYTGRDGLSHGILIFAYVGTVAVTLTFLVVAVFLGPIYGYGAMFAGYNFWLHGANPILCILALMVLLRGPIRPREILWCLVPVFIYGVLYLVMTVILGPDAGGWPDFYAFNMGGRWYVTYLVIAAVTLGIAALERIPHRVP